MEQIRKRAWNPGVGHAPEVPQVQKCWNSSKLDVWYQQPWELARTGIPIIDIIEHPIPKRYGKISKVTNLLKRVLQAEGDVELLLSQREKKDRIDSSPREDKFKSEASQHKNRHQKPMKQVTISFSCVSQPQLAPKWTCVVESCTEKALSQFSYGLMKWRAKNWRSKTERLMRYLQVKIKSERFRWSICERVKHLSPWCTFYRKAQFLRTR